MMESYYIKVRKENASKMLKKLKEEKKLRKELKLKRKGNYILIPVVSPIEKKEKEDFEEMKREESLLKEMKKRGVEIKKHSYDVVGDIAIVEIDEKDKKNEMLIGELISRISKVRTVYAKESAMQGEYRVRKLRLVYGKDNPITIYKENGVRMKLNVKEVFFSPRLSFERKRISELVKEKEKVLVMFAGVGPFALVIGKKCKTCSVVGIELNKKAVKYFEENIKLNKLDNVRAIEGDVKEVVYREGMKDRFDHVIMPLPKDAEHFLEDAYYTVKNKGIIYFYTFVKRENAFKEGEEKIKKYIKNYRILNKRKVRDYSKDIIQIVMDVEVLK